MLEKHDRLPTAKPPPLHPTKPDLRDADSAILTCQPQIRRQICVPRHLLTSMDASHVKRQHKSWVFAVMLSTEV